MCHQMKADGKRVLVAAADTFRAAAIDQLQVWTDRSDVELVRHAEGSDPAAVVFDAITAAKARGCDVVICDTAGRLHNKKNLMQELAKINRIIDREAEGCAKECLLVLDATTGQNAVNQAKLFQEVAPITGIVLTKLDGTAKGGIVISIRHELGIPVKLIGVGEGIDDLQPFDSKTFIDALFDQAPELPADAEAETEAETEAGGETVTDEEIAVTDEAAGEETVTGEAPAAAEEATAGEAAAVPEEAAAEEETTVTAEAVTEAEAETPAETADTEAPAEAPAEEQPKKKRGFLWWRK